MDSYRTHPARSRAHVAHSRSEANFSPARRSGRVELDCIPPACIVRLVASAGSIIVDVQMILPTDVVIADKFAADAASKVVAAEAIPAGWLGVDNGPKATAEIQAALADCKTVVWNGPMGVFEMEPFAKGTFAIADTLADLTDKGAVSIIGGGDSVAAVNKAGLAPRMSHISTGGGASLELLEGKVLPGVDCLDDA